MQRGGGKVALSIDPVEAESWYLPRGAVDNVTPERLFEHRWALSLLEEVMAKLRAEFVQGRKVEHFDRLSPFLHGDSNEIRYEALAAEMGVAPGALRTSVHRMRRKYRALLRAEIALTVSAPEEIDDEIRFLLTTLSG